MKIDSNPDHNLVSFDNLPVAFIAIFTVSTMEGWTRTMYKVSDAVHWGADFYFIALIVLCSFFVLNLILAAIKANFTSDRSLILYLCISLVYCI